jgi:hypothetical protein
MTRLTIEAIEVINAIERAGSMSASCNLLKSLSR